MQKKYSANLAFSIAIVIVVFFCASCKKSSNSTSTPTCTLSATSLIGTWGYKSITYQKTSTSPIVDILDDPTQFPVCQKDNTTTYSANGVFSYGDAGVMCSPNSSYTSTWTLSNNTILVSSIAHELTVTSFDCQTMVITVSDFDTTGDKEVLTYQKN